jgi:hypothetical protein
MKIILVNDSRYLIIEEIQFQHKFIIFFIDVILYFMVR